MDLAAFEESAARGAEPPGLPAALRALWVLARDAWTPDAWDAAHRLVQEDRAPAAAWVHALLHRAEGDPANARYWYARAQRPPCAEPPEAASLHAEWRAAATALLAAHDPESPP